MFGLTYLMEITSRDEYRRRTQCRVIIFGRVAVALFRYHCSGGAALYMHTQSMHHYCVAFISHRSSSSTRAAPLREYDTPVTPESVYTRVARAKRSLANTSTAS